MRDSSPKPHQQDLNSSETIPKAKRRRHYGVGNFSVLATLKQQRGKRAHSPSPPPSALHSSSRQMHPLPKHSKKDSTPHQDSTIPPRLHHNNLAHRAPQEGIPLDDRDITMEDSSSCSGPVRKLASPITPIRRPSEPGISPNPPQNESKPTNLTHDAISLPASPTSSSLRGSVEADDVFQQPVLACDTTPSHTPTSYSLQGSIEVDDGCGLGASVAESPGGEQKVSVRDPSSQSDNQIMNNFRSASSTQWGDGNAGSDLDTTDTCMCFSFLPPIDF